MHILILGAGVIGVSTAYELLKDGHDVTIIDRQSAPAMETSFKNGGLIAPGHSFALSGEKIPFSSFFSKNQKNSSFRFKFQWDLNFWKWGIQFLKHLRSGKSQNLTLKKCEFCLYSQRIYHKTLKETGISIKHSKTGLIYFFRTEDSLEKAIINSEFLQQISNSYKNLNGDELISLEPALGPIKNEIAGGIYCTTDESVDCKKFVDELMNDMYGKIECHFNTTIQKIISDSEKVRRVITDRGEFEADAYILCLASYSPFYAKQVGDELPIYPIKGYSVTVPIKDEKNVPVIGGIDEDNHLAFSRIGNNVRFTSIAEIAGFDLSHELSDFHYLIEKGKSLFPSVLDWQKADYWAGLRPMTTNGLPVLGKGKMDNLFYNTGHGQLGWTMACGSAKITADLVSNRIPEIDLGRIIIK